MTFIWQIKLDHPVIRTFWTFNVKEVPQFFFSLIYFHHPTKTSFHRRISQHVANCKVFYDYYIFFVVSKVNKQIPSKIYYWKVLVFVFDVTLFKHFLNYELIFYSFLMFFYRLLRPNICIFYKILLQFPVVCLMMEFNYFIIY